MSYSVKEVLDLFGSRSRIPTAWDTDPNGEVVSNLQEPDWTFWVPIVGENEKGDIVVTEREVLGRDYLLPSLHTQWKWDFQMRVEKARKSGSSWCSAHLRAPKEFIETGRWPKDEPRPIR